MTISSMPASHGGRVASAKGQDETDRFLTQLKRFGYINSDLPQFSDQPPTIEIKLDQAIIANPLHVLHQLIPPLYSQPYNLRHKPLNCVLPKKYDRNFITRLL